MRALAVAVVGIAGITVAMRRVKGRAPLAPLTRPTRPASTPEPEPPAGRCGHRRRRVVGFAAAVVIVAGATVTYAFWTAGGAGASAATGSDLTAGSVSVPSSSNGANTLTWTSQGALNPVNAASAGITYTVQRRTGAGAFADVASGNCAGAQPYNTTSCVDIVSASGTYSYRLVAKLNSWDATSAASGNVVSTVDTTDPTVSSINRVGSATTTNAGSVQWLVTFSETVSGVDSSDFQLAGTATSGASITSVTGSGSTRTVTVNTGPGSGTLGLNLVDDDSIVDTAASPRPLGGIGTGNGNKTGATFTMDKTAPTVTLLRASSTTATNASSITFSATFSETVTAVDASDFALTTTGTLSGVSITGVTGSGTTRTITAATGSGDGTIAIRLDDDDTIIDAVGNNLGGTGTGNGNFTGTTVATIDRTPPTLSTLQFFDTDLNGKVNQVKATFNETLASSTATGPWTLTGAPSGGTLASVSTSTTVATLTLAEGSGAADTGVGTFRVALAADATGIRDVAGNQASFATTAPADKARPIVTNVVDTSGATNGKLEAGDTLTATFSEAIASGLTASPTIQLVRPSSGNVTLSVPGFTSAASSLGSTDYLSAAGTVNFAGSAAVGAGNTVTVTLGSCTSTTALCNTVSPGTGTTFVYTPSTALLDAGGNTAGGTRSAGVALF